MSLSCITITTTLATSVEGVVVDDGDDTTTTTTTTTEVDCVQVCSEQVAIVMGQLERQQQHGEHQWKTQQTKLDSCLRVAAAQDDMNQSLTLSVKELIHDIATLQHQVTQGVALQQSIHALHDEYKALGRLTQEMKQKSDAAYVTSKEERRMMQMKAIQDDTEVTKLKREIHALNNRSYINMHKIMGLFGY